MSHAAPRPLPENAGLGFQGERVALAASIPPKMAERMLGTRNPHGKSNADVVRPLATAADGSRPVVHWLIDFPRHMGEREASLYEHPFHQLHRAMRPTRDRWWVNPHADEHLRTSLARRERYLATPIGADPPAWIWFDSAILPDETLIVVARDDDFTHGILSSRLFAVWWRQVHSRRTPTLAVATYPFPWSPGKGLSDLSATQEEQRHAIARAARSGNPDPLDDAVAAAYGWAADLTDDELLERLDELNQAKAKL
jgi:hypothetical protein